MKVALYARVSTKASDKKITSAGEREKQNPEAQLQRLRDFCRSHDWEISGEYLDRASGAKMARPQLQQVLDDAKAGKFDIILITKLDRMMRSMINLINIVTGLRSWNVGVVCIDQSIDTRVGSPTANLTMNILASVAEFERELISERVKDSDLSKAGRPRKHKHIDDRMVREALRGRSLEKAAEYLQVPESTLRYWVKKLGGLSVLRQEGGVKNPSPAALNTLDIPAEDRNKEFFLTPPVEGTRDGTPGGISLSNELSNDLDPDRRQPVRNRRQRI